jgi:hypothetical protein
MKRKKLLRRKARDRSAASARPEPKRARSSVESTARDPFEVIGNRRNGIDYQWVATSVMGDVDVAAGILARMQGDGWKPVAAKRHPKMRHDKKGRIVIDGQMLMERPLALSDAARKEEIDAARAMVNDHAGGGGTYGGSVSTVKSIEPDASYHSPRGQYFTDQDINRAREGLERQDGHRYVEVTVGVTIDEDELQTAMAILGLQPQEYVRRRIHMDTTALVLVPTNRRDTEIPLFRRGEMFVKATPLEKAR